MTLSSYIINSLLESTYRGSHSAPGKDNGAPLYDLTNIYPEDIYSMNGAKYYGHYGDSRDYPAIQIIQSYKGRPNKPITIYRAVPPTKEQRIDKLIKQKAYIMKHGKVPVPTPLSPSAYYEKITNEIAKTLPEQPTIVISPGDWVTTVRSYAKEHGESTLSGEYQIIKKTVKARDIFTDGNSIYEWGYDPQ